MDYDRLAATAQRLIEANGRSLFITRLARGVVDNGAKPWRGQAEPRAVGSNSTTLPVKAVFIEPASLARYGFTGVDDELVRRYKEFVLIAANSVDQVDITDYDEMIDDPNAATGDRWRINYVTSVHPGPKFLLFVFGVSR